MSCHCPSHGEVLAPASMTHCPLCGLPLLVSADGGHGLRWLDDHDRADATRALEEPGSISWADLKQELGL